MVITFDTHKFIRRLRDAGFAEPQAEAVAGAFREAQGETDTSTKADVDNAVLLLERDIKEAESLLKRDIKETELRLDAKLLEMENRLVKWGIGLALGQFALIAALVKLL